MLGRRAAAAYTEKRYAMEIDLTQVPIPDWDVACPKCRYPLRGLPSHRCPECGTELDLPALVQSWVRLRDPIYTGNELPLPDFGLRCAACGQALAGAPRRECPHCGAAFDPQQLRPTREWFVIDAELCGRAPLAGVQALLGAEQVPYVPYRDKTFREIYFGTQVVGVRLLAPSEFFFDVLALVRRVELDMQEAQTTGVRDRWTCPKCGSRIPGNFDICWNCETPREE